MVLQFLFYQFHHLSTIYLECIVCTHLQTVSKAKQKVKKKLCMLSSEMLFCIYYVMLIHSEFVKDALISLQYVLIRTLLQIT